MLATLTLPPLTISHFPKFISIFTSLARKYALLLFYPALRVFLDLFSPVIVPSTTPTLEKPHPTWRAVGLSNGSDGDNVKHKEAARKAALEFMVTLTEADPNLAQEEDHWVPTILKACLLGMSEFGNADLRVWLESAVRTPPSLLSSSMMADYVDYVQPVTGVVEDSYPLFYEQSLERLADALGGKAILPYVLQHLPSPLASADWQLRHAGLMAIAMISRGTTEVC